MHQTLKNKFNEKNAYEPHTVYIKQLITKQCRDTARHRVEVSPVGCQFFLKGAMDLIQSQ